MEKHEIEELKARTNIVDVIGRRVELKKRGTEFYGKCPFHDDHKLSLQVNEQKQVFKCFACDDKAGDSIQFLLEMGIEFKDVLIELNGGPISNGIAPEIKNIPKRINENPWEFLTDAPQEKPLINHYKYGEPHSLWSYKNKDGNIVSYVCRFNISKTEKIVLPYSYATNGETNQWRWMGMATPRIIYNLHLIHKYPKATILVVEGEKTADAAQAKLDPNRTVVITWVGGANGVKNTDWTSLYNRKVIFFPDNDFLQKYGEKHQKSGELKPWHEQPGNLAMLNIFEIVKSKLILSKWVPTNKDLPHKWDVADKDWTDGELRKYILDKIIEVPKVEKEVEKQQPSKKIIPPKLPPPKKKRDDFFENDHYRFLGYDKDEKSTLVYYFYSFDAKSVIKYSPSSMTPSNLLMIAPVNYWEEWFPKKNGFDTAMAQQFLISNSHKRGTFQEKKIRGRGAWIDEGKLVIHSGEKLLIDDKLVDLKQHKSVYVYEIGESLGFGDGEPLLTKDSSKILEKIKWLNWERGANGHLLAGWAVLAPFCGVLDWRPHIWVTGPVGSGKSWVMEKMIKVLMGESAIIVQGKTTEAGVRGLLQSDARPVLFDESDVDDYRDSERIQSILALARSASYSNGGGVVKGTQSGLSRTYIIRSMFSFASIGVQVTKQSDRSRFTLLGLKAFENEKKQDEFIEFELKWNELLSNKFVHGLQARTRKLLPIILDNTKTFADAVTKVIGNRRIGDQIGGMLAGSWSLVSKNLISYEKAVEWVEKMDWSEERGLEQTKDEKQLLTIIMTTLLRIDGEMGTVERGIGELILVAANLVTGNRVTPAQAKDRLKRSGILVIEDRFIMANTSPSIKSIINGTSWSKNHGKILERLPGAESTTPRYFASGLNSRGVSIPVDLIYNSEIIESTAGDHDYSNYTSYENPVMDPKDDEIPF